MILKPCASRVEGFPYNVFPKGRRRLEFSAELAPQIVIPVVLIFYVPWDIETTDVKQDIFGRKKDGGYKLLGGLVPRATFLLLLSFLLSNPKPKRLCQLIYYPTLDLKPMQTPHLHLPPPEVCDVAKKDEDAASGSPVSVNGPSRATSRRHSSSEVLFTKISKEDETSLSEAVSDVSNAAASTSTSGPTEMQAPKREIKRRNVGVPKFLRYLFQILETEDTSVICWAHGGTAFQIRNPQALASHILPKYFKHNKVASFQRQLNYFGFKKWTKTQTSVCTFSHPCFLRFDRDRIKLIKRKERHNSLPQPPFPSPPMPHDYHVNTPGDVSFSGGMMQTSTDMYGMPQGMNVMNSNRPNVAAGRRYSTGTLPAAVQFLQFQQQQQQLQNGMSRKRGAMMADCPEGLPQTQARRLSSASCINYVNNSNGFLSPSGSSSMAFTDFSGTQDNNFSNGFHQSLVDVEEEERDQDCIDKNNGCNYYGNRGKRKSLPQLNTGSFMPAMQQGGRPSNFVSPTYTMNGQENGTMGMKNEPPFSMYHDNYQPIRHAYAPHSQQQQPQMSVPPVNQKDLLEALMDVSADSPTMDGMRVAHSFMNKQMSQERYA